jgi:hypothetical protein
MNIHTKSAFDPAEWVPPEVGPITDHQTDLPRIAKDKKATLAIEAKLAEMPTWHHLYREKRTEPIPRDARL